MGPVKGLHSIECNFPDALDEDCRPNRSLGFSLYLNLNLPVLSFPPAACDLLMFHPKTSKPEREKTLSVPGKLINQLCFKLNYASCVSKPNQKVQNTRLLENWRSCIKICVAHPGDVFMACWALDQAPKLVVT